MASSAMCLRYTNLDWFFITPHMYAQSLFTFQAKGSDSAISSLKPVQGLPLSHRLHNRISKWTLKARARTHTHFYFLFFLILVYILKSCPLICQLTICCHYVPLSASFSTLILEPGACQPSRPVLLL